MNIEVKTEDDLAIAVVTGDIDGKTAPEAQAQLLPVIGGYSRLVLEMEGVGFLSSAGLRMLLLLYRQATTRNGKVALVGLSDQIKDTMSMTGFLKFFVVADSREEALKALS
jgi:anti-sigma B factor antagonist